jgi:uncharacterized protein YdhG (YjbR/CyaY superfamily)
MPSKDMDEYLAPLPPDARAALEGLRAVIKAAAPAATETISYQIPTFKHAGRMLVGFAAAKNHCTFHVMSTAVMDAHAAELEGFATGKGSVRFVPGKPLPAELVARLVRARIAENEAARRVRRR